jgi:hypothetical protein
VSPVTYPAYPQTDLSARSFYEARMKGSARDIEKIVFRQLGEPEINPEEDPEKVKADLLARAQARRDLIARLTPKPDPMSYTEILKACRVKT